MTNSNVVKTEVVRIAFTKIRIPIKLGLGDGGATAHVIVLLSNSLYSGDFLSTLLRVRLIFKPKDL